MLSPVVHLDKVPDLHVEGWAVAMACVLREWRDSQDEAHRDRMLKWLVALNDILLRLPPRGGRRGRAPVSHRFSAWAQGDYATLIRWWQADRAAARRPRYASTYATAERSIDRALGLFRSGQISRAVQCLDGDGLGDLKDDCVVEQLCGKHPARKEAVADPEHDNSGVAYPRLTVKLWDTLRKLDEKAGGGVSGFRNSFLTALTQDFSDPPGISSNSTFR